MPVPVVRFGKPPGCYKDVLQASQSRGKVADAMELTNSGVEDGHFRQAFENDNDLGLIFDAGGTLVHANAAARRFTGTLENLRTRTDLLAPLGVANSHSRQQAFADLLDRRRRPAQVTCDWTDQHQQTRRIRWRHQIVADAQGRPEAVICLGHDITATADEIRSLRRTRDFTAFQARVNRALMYATDETRLLDNICQLAVDYAGAQLAWFGRPGAGLRFEILASAGPAAASYLDGIVVSADPAEPEGQGPWGRTWREERVLFYRSFTQTPAFAPWQARAAASGLESSATLPIFREGRVWAVFSVYLPEALWFDPDLRGVLESLALDISQGLDAMDAKRLNSALTRHTEAAISVTRHRKLAYVNPRLAQLFGADSAESMAGLPTRTLYPDRDTYERVGAAYADIERHGETHLQDLPCRRRDGSLFWCDMTGTRLDAETTVWTLIDVTVRAHQRRQIERLSAFNALLAQVNHLFTHEADEPRLLQAICDLAVKHAGVSLAWIGRPDGASRFEFLASAGPARPYLDGITISSDADIPEGQGGVGHVWRTGQPYAHNSFVESPVLRPWAKRAERFGLKASVVLPIRRGGAVWAILCLYASEVGIFDERLREVLQELSNHISAGLDTLDLAQRERETSNLNALLLGALNVGVIVVRYPEREIEQANAQLLQMAGVADFEALKGLSARDFYKDENTFARVANLARQILAQGDAGLTDIPYRSLDGRELWVDVFGHRLDRGDGVQRIIWTHIDVTQRHHQTVALKQLSEMRQTLLSNTVVGITLVRYPDRVIIDANKGSLDIMGYGQDPEAVIGQSVRVIYDQASEDERIDRLARNILADGSGSISAMEMKNRQGERVYLDLHGRRLESSDPEHPVIVWTAVDVTERQALAQALNRQALFDELTNLPNRRALEQHLTLAIARARHQGTRLAVGMIDLDDFKPVNDAHGHDGGDELLEAFANRMQSVLREHDFIARVGGDEFVAVLDGLDPDAEGPALSEVWEQLHHAVESPFEIGDGQRVQMEMSMGIALCPDDSTDPDALIRRADEAMYQAKANKLDRGHWWNLHSKATAQKEQADPFDPFGPRARALLAHVEAQLASTSERFARELYDELLRRPESAAILSNLSAAEFDALRDTQASHLKFLMAPQTTEAEIEERAGQTARAHALCGVTPDWIAEGMMLYSQLLRSTLEQLVTTSQRRYRLVRTADTRVGLHMHIELRAMQSVIDAYHDHTARSLLLGETWASIAQKELDALATLPGVMGCQVMRPDSEGQFAIEMSAGQMSDALILQMDRHSLLPHVDTDLDTGRGLVGTAWRSGRVQRCDAVQYDPRTQAWHSLYTDLGLRSLLVVPVHQRDAVAFLLVIEGSYPNQFSSAWMQSFATSLAQRWERLVTSRTQWAAPVEQTRASRYRTLLREGGLRMYFQPAIRLDTGAPDKVEALARLETPDGEVISPGQFMPALRDEDFHALFRNGLDQSLGYLTLWRQNGLQLDLSLNISPSTLLQPACASWVSRALHKHDVSPRRLTLEILETQDLDERQYDAAIERLRRVGVRLAIDDLGSGYSSLNRLARLPVSVIKIDQALVRNITTEPVKTLSLLNTLTTIGNDLGRSVVVEGVEDEATLDAIRVLGADYAQGFTIARPMPASRLPEWCANWLQSFTPNQTLRTHLGALAHHWRSFHQVDSSCQRDYAKCPLTAFLDNCEAQGGQAGHWHRCVHEFTAPRRRLAAQHRLTRWLVREVRSGG